MKAIKSGKVAWASGWSRPRGLRVAFARPRDSGTGWSVDVYDGRGRWRASIHAREKKDAMRLVASLRRRGIVRGFRFDGRDGGRVVR